MNTGLQKLAIVVRDLLEVDESIIMIGRENFRIDDFVSQQIVVEMLAPASRINKAETYDGDSESMEYSQRFVAPCTINFYGNTAFQDATNFSLLIQSQAGYELQRDNEISVYSIGQLADVKLLTGEQYSDRIEISLYVQFSVAVSVDTLRIDTVQYTILED